MQYTLSLTFITASGEKASMSISDVKSTTTGVEASALMDVIIANDVFVDKNGPFVSKFAAQLTRRQVSKFDL